MITPVLLSVLGSVVGTAVAQTFEPVDFNVTEGLLDLGIDVTQLPELSDLVERSTNSHCAAAVSLIPPHFIRSPMHRPRCRY